MSDKKSAPKENLNWKINYLAAQVGEKTHMKTAIIAAARTKYQKIHSAESRGIDPQALKEELYNARKLKLESKLHQARKDIKAALKKGKQAETQKQIKKIKSSRKLLELPEEKQPKKKITAEEVEGYEKELEILKNIDLDLLVEKVLKSKLQKNATLKNEELIQDLIQTSLKPVDKKNDQSTQNIESRLIAQEEVTAEIGNTMTAFQHIISGNNEKIAKRIEEEKKKKTEEEKKRKAEEQAEEDKKNTKKPKIKDGKKKNKGEAGTSEFMETLGVSDDEADDENFKKIYEGEKKPNRVGQRARRKQWEEMYGREANHIAAEFKKREEKRLANPDYRPKKKPAAPKPAARAAPSEPVHPSWEAKRIQEEIMSKALSGKGASNNKIVFDDSD